MSNKNLPSNNPGDKNSLEGVLSFAMRKGLQRIDGQLPAVVISYNRQTNRAIVRPIIAVLTTSGEAVARAQIASVPVLALGGGGYVLNFPLNAGDFGWIEASDRDISLFMQAMGTDAKPNTARLHSFEDARFIPDAFGKYVVNGADTTAVVLQTLNGSTRIALDASGVRITGGAIKINGATIELTATTSITLNAPIITETAATSVTLATPVIALGAAALSSTGSLDFNGIEFSDHTHTSSVPGTQTSTPNP